METLDELMKIINYSLDNEYWIAKNPKRCVLNEYWELTNVPGYVVVIYDRDNEKDFLFIADDRQRKAIYSYGFIVERSELLARRCLLLEDKDIRITEKGLWI